MPPEQPLPCIVCGTELEPAFSGTGRAESQPSEAVMFYAYGQYGSTVFDPQDNSQLQVNICDSCLLIHRNRVWHARYVRQPLLEAFSEPWRPDADSELMLGLQQLAAGQRRRWEKKANGWWGPAEPES